MASAGSAQSSLTSLEDGLVASSPGTSASGSREPKPSRQAHLDVFRAFAVAAVAIEHFSTELSEYNVAFAQETVLPSLFVISGTCWAMSRQPVTGYLSRLFTYFIVGVAVNMLAILVRPSTCKGVVSQALLDDLQRNSTTVLRCTDLGFQPAYSGGDNLVTHGCRDCDGYFLIDGLHDVEFPFAVPFQMYYVILLMVTTLLTAPFRWAANGSFRNRVIVCSAWSMLVAASSLLLYFQGWTFLMRFLSPYYRKPDLKFLLGLYFLESFIAMWLVSVALLLKKGTAMLFWSIWLLIYIPRAIYPHQDIALWYHENDLFLLGWVAQTFPPTGKARLGRVLRAYWPLLFLFPMGVMMVPGMRGRWDISPPGSRDWVENLLPMNGPAVHHTPWFEARVRTVAMEALLVLYFVIIGADIVADPFHITACLTRWALLTYMCHMAIHRLAPFPLNFMLCFGLLPLLASVPELRAYLWPTATPYPATTRDVSCADTSLEEHNGCTNGVCIRNDSSVDVSLNDWPGLQLPLRKAG